MTIIPLLNLKCKTASQWCINVLTISPVFTSHTLTVESLDPLIITLSSYCKHSTEPVWPVSIWKCEKIGLISSKLKFQWAYLVALQCISIPNFNGIVAKSRNNLIVVILKTIDSLRVLRPTIYSLQIVITRTPIILYGVDILQQKNYQI